MVSLCYSTSWGGGGIFKTNWHIHWHDKTLPWQKKAHWSVWRGPQKSTPPMQNRAVLLLRGQAVAILAHSVPTVVALVLSPHLDALAVMAFSSSGWKKPGKEPRTKTGKKPEKAGQGQKKPPSWQLWRTTWPQNGPGPFPASYLIHWAQLCSWISWRGR